MDHTLDQDQTRSKLLQLFNYIQAFNHLQNPVQRNIASQPWTLWFQNLPPHPSIQIGIPTLVSDDQFGAAADTGDTFLLKVRRSRLTEPPKPSADIAMYLKSGWDDPLTELVFDARVRANEVLHARFETWLQRYTTWAALERPARQAQLIFDRLYELQTQLERETEQLELMVGDGILHWQTRQNIAIHHPTLLMRVQLHFDPQIPEFTVSETEQPPEFYSALLQGITEVSPQNLSLIRQDFESRHWHPLDLDDTMYFFQRMIHHLSPKGQFVQDQTLIKPSSDPWLFRQPVLFVRKRTLGFSTAIEAILDDIPQRAQLPYALTSLVGITSQPNSPQQTQTHPFSSPNGEDEHILLSKPANAEQLEVAQKLEQYGAVLVQGPPGTGKTHTIANLLGHLLAQGKSVLVTSHTSKALKVLHEKIVTPLQPLCVSMLEDDNRKQMTQAIDAITERLSTENEQRLGREADQLNRQRINVIQQIRHDRDEMKLARSSEYITIAIDGLRYTPSEAARYIVAHAEAGWLQDPVPLNAPLPLSAQELIDLYRTNKTVSAQDEQDIVQGLPDIQKLLAPAEFEQRLREIETIQQAQKQRLQENLGYRSDLWRPATTQGQTLASFQGLQRQLEDALAFFNDEVPWRLAVIQAGQEGGMRRQIWEELIVKIEYTHTLALQTTSLLLEYDPFIPDDCLPGQIEKVLQDMFAYLEKGRTLNGITLMMHADWKTVAAKTQVQGRAPTAKEHIQALLAQVTLKRARKDLVGRWQRQITPLGAHDAVALGQYPEQICHQYVYRLQQCLDWYQRIWLPLESQLKQQGFLWEKLLTELPVTVAEHDLILKYRIVVREYLPALLVAEEKRRVYTLNDKKRHDIENTLQRMLLGSAPTPLMKRAQVAIEHRDLQAYSACYAYIIGLCERQKEQQKRSILLTKLERAAPSWAASIRERDDTHGAAQVPATVDEAWLCKKLKDELNRRTSISLADVQERIASNTTALQMITAELVEKKAWAAQIRRTTLEQRRALQGWKELMRKVGKGTGKRAPQLLAEARQLMPLCQTAVPVWIMPLSRVVQNFDPRQNRFDVVIIDEASQADIKALTAIYMGAQIVIVGDHEQVTPLAVGQNLDDIDKLICEYLEGIPLKELYDGKLSIYGLTMTTFQPVCLREHFRCVSPIIQFSNNLSYGGKIKPLRDDSDVQVRPATIEYSVNGSEANGYVNEEEAITLASLVVSASEHPEYRNATMGIISMLREEQALRIDTLLRRYLPATEYVRRQILCGTPAQFQGDERDIMFLSLVVTPHGDGPLALLDEDARDATAKKRFNVAASRARDQMWVIHSLDPDRHLKDGDIRKKLILHARNPRDFAHMLAEQEQRTESEFERQVLKRLLAAGYRVIPQWPVGAYRIDLVVEGNNKRLAVECDGDRWHPIEKLEADMARQAILERLGWRFIRIRGSQFFRNPEKAIEPVLAKLQALEIRPEESTTDEVTQARNSQDLKQQVIRRAAELRELWSTTKL